MKILYYNGEEIGHVITNKSLVLDELIYAIGYDINDNDSLEQAYRDGFPAAYQDDNGYYQIDVENIKVVGVED